MSFRFIHAADLHLDSPMLGLAKAGQAAKPFLEATRGALANLVRLAVERDVRFVVVAGDVYDRDWRDFATGHFLVGQVAQLAKAGIDVVLSSGNHDAGDVVTRVLSFPPKVHVLPNDRCGTILLEDAKVAIHGRGFQTHETDENVALGYPAARPGYFNVGVLHTSMESPGSHSPYAPCSLADLLSRSYDYWALGHIHQRRVVHADPPVVYPGNVQGRHSRETGAKGATVVEVVDGRVSAMEHVDLHVARFETCVIDASAMTTRPELEAEVSTRVTALHARCGGLPVALRLEVNGYGLRSAKAVSAHHVQEELRAVVAGVSPDILLLKAKVGFEVASGDADAVAFDPDLAGCVDEAAGDAALRAGVLETVRKMVEAMPPEIAGDVDVETIVRDSFLEARGRISASMGGPS